MGGGGRGYFGLAAIYCITTWCFALKGLRTTRAESVSLRFYKTRVSAALDCTLKHK